MLPNAVCCCEHEPYCTGISVKSHVNWGGFGEIPEWCHGGHTIETGDSDEYYAAFLVMLEAVFGPTASGFDKRFSWWGDSYNWCLTRYLNKSCGWSATHVFDESEGAVGFSQERTAEVERHSGVLVAGSGSNAGSTTFWSLLGVTGPENIGIFWEYDLDESDGSVTENGSIYSGYAAADMPKAITYLGALAYLIASPASGWPAGCSITMDISATSATLYAFAPAGAFFSVAISTNAFVTLSNAYTRDEAVDDAQSYLDAISLERGGSYEVWVSGSPVTKTMDWMHEGRETSPVAVSSCVTSWTRKYEFWPLALKNFADGYLDDSFNCGKMTVSARRELLQADDVDAIGFITDVVMLEKGRVPARTSNCATHHELEFSITLSTIDLPNDFNTRYQCNYCERADSSCPPSAVITGGFVPEGIEYVIEAVGPTTDFTGIGAPNNNVGTVFTSTGGNPVWDGGRLRRTDRPNNADVTCEYPYDSDRIEPDDMIYYWGHSDLRQRCTLQRLQANPDDSCLTSTLCYAERPIHYAPYEDTVSNCCPAPPSKLMDGDVAAFGPDQPGSHFVEPEDWNEAQWWKCEPRDVGGVGTVTHCARDTEPAYASFAFGPLSLPFTIDALLYDFNGDLASFSLSRFLGSETGAETVLIAPTGVSGCTSGTPCSILISDILGVSFTDSPPSGSWYYRLRVTDSAGQTSDSWRLAIVA